MQTNAAGISVVAIHSYVIGDARFSVKGNETRVISAALIVTGHRSKIGQRGAGINRQQRIKITSNSIDGDGARAVRDPIPPDGFATIQIVVQRLGPLKRRAN